MINNKITVGCLVKYAIDGDCYEVIDEPSHGVFYIQSNNYTLMTTAEKLTFVANYNSNKLAKRLDFNELKLSPIDLNKIFR